MPAPTYKKPLKVESKDIYTPSRWGEVFHNLFHDHALGAGSAGPGKTEVLIHEFDRIIATEHDRCVRASDHPYPLHWGASKGWGIFLRRSFKELGPTIARTKRIFPLMDPGCRWVQDSDEMALGWIFSSGFHLQMGHCKDPDDFEAYLGAEFTKICFDELVTFLEEQYDGISSRLRSDDPVLSDPRNRLMGVRSMSNPVFRRSAGSDNYLVKNPHWVRDRFVEPWRKGEKTLNRRLKMFDGTYETFSMIYLPARLTDNPNKEFARHFEKTLRTLKPYMRKALLEGDWYYLAGAFFGDEWEPDIHICKPFHIATNWRRFRSMDWGYKKQGVIHWWAMDDDGNIYCEREYSFKLQTVDKVATRVKEIECGLGLWENGKSLIPGVADTQLWEKRGDIGRSKAEEFAHRGVLWSPADKKSRHRNAERLSARLVSHEDNTTIPGFNVFDTCPMLIKTMPSIQADPDDPETPLDGGDDHWLDSALYACAYADHGTAGIPHVNRKRKDRIDEMIDDDDDEVVSEDRGQLGYGSMY